MITDLFLKAPFKIRWAFFKKSLCPFFCIGTCQTDGKCIDFNTASCLEIDIHAGVDGPEADGLAVAAREVAVRRSFDPAGRAGGRSWCTWAWCD